MYTRSYNIRSQRQADIQQPENNRSKQEESDITEIPEGYSGTLILREQEQSEHLESENAEYAEESREEQFSPIRRHRPVRFNFTRSQKHPVESEKENTAPEERVRHEYNPPVKHSQDIFESINEQECVPARPEPKRKNNQLDRMLLGALILMLMSEGADDVLLLILGYLFV